MAAYTKFFVFRKAAPKNKYTGGSLKVGERGRSLFLLLFPISSKNTSVYKLFTATYFLLKNSRGKQLVVAFYEALVDSCLYFPAGVRVHLESMKFLSLFLISCSIQYYSAAF